MLRWLFKVWLFRKVWAMLTGGGRANPGTRGRR